MFTCMQRTARLKFFSFRTKAVYIVPCTPTKNREFFWGEGNRIFLHKFSLSQIEHLITNRQKYNNPSKNMFD